MTSTANSSLGKSARKIAVATGLILLVPLVAMQLTPEVTWQLGDFAVAAALLFGAGMTYVLAARLARQNYQRVATAVVLVAFSASVWIQLAVGIFS